MFEFRELEKVNIDRIMEIERNSFAQNTWEDEGVYLERIRVFPEGNLGIFSDGGLIGFISSELWDFKEIYEKTRFALSHNIEDYHSYSGKELYISSFAVDVGFRGKGMGNAVFMEFLRLMESKFGIKSSVLLVSDEWTGAKKIYADYGYESIDEIPEFFLNDNGEKFKGIIMRKSM